MTWLVVAGIFVLLSHYSNLVMKGYVSDKFLCMNSTTSQLYTRVSTDTVRGQTFHTYTQRGLCVLGGGGGEPWRGGGRIRRQAGGKDIREVDRWRLARNRKRGQKGGREKQEKKEEGQEGREVEKEER